MKKLFFIMICLVCNLSSSQSIVSAEYFFDDDPGVGNGTILSVNTNMGELSQSYSIPTTGLSNGFHSLYIRTLNNGDKWSLYDRHIVYIKEPAHFGSNIISAEYFIDSDPGSGNGIPISVDSTVQQIVFSTSGLSDGDHLFYIRVLNQEGQWSFYDYALFSINPNLGMKENLLKSIMIYPNPVKDVVNIFSSVDIIIENVTIYDLNGKAAYQNKENLRQFDLSGFVSGIYLLKLKTNRGTVSYKLFKQ